MKWRARTAGRWLGGIAVTAAALVVGVPLAASGFVRVIELLLDACMSLALAISAGASAWSIGRTVARSLASELVTPQGTGIIGTLVAVAVVALWGLQRLLGSEGE